MYFEVDGMGKALLCIHGNRDSSVVFKSICGRLKNDYYTISPDLRGHGGSVYKGGPFTITDMADDIIELLDKLYVERVSILGHSLGSTLGMMLALRLQERVEKLVLVGAAASFKPSFKRPDVGETITPEIVERTNKAVAEFFFTTHNEGVKDFILRGWASMHPEMHQLMMRIKHPDLSPFLGKIKQPALLICGQDDKVTPVEKSMELNEKLVDSRLFIIPKAGHFVFLEEEEKVYKAVISFLKETL